jgi:hypothetical protein
VDARQNRGIHGRPLRQSPTSTQVHAGYVSRTRPSGQISVADAAGAPTRRTAAPAAATAAARTRRDMGDSSAERPVAAGDDR